MNETELISGSGDDLRVALNLMRLALPLLDRAGEKLAAAGLRHAIDAAKKRETSG